MDTTGLVAGITIFSSALSALKQAIDLLPDGAKKEAAKEAAERAEREFKVAEAAAAQNMGYLICKNHFPPGVMLSADDVHWKCSDCGNEVNNSYFG